MKPGTFRRMNNGLRLTFWILGLIELSNAAGGGPAKGDWQFPVNSADPCIKLQSAIDLYLTYYKKDLTQKDGVVHVPVKSKVNEARSSCASSIKTNDVIVNSQLITLDLDGMPGWSITFAFTQDSRFHTNEGKQYVLYLINVTAQYDTYTKEFPDAAESSYTYYTPIQFNDDDKLELSEALYADNGYSFYCPSPNKFPINRNKSIGPPAYIQFTLFFMQAYKTSHGQQFDEREVCPTDQHTTDKVPIIVGGVLAGLILLTLVLYLVYRAILPPEVLHLIAESSSKESDSIHESDEVANSDDEEQRHGAHRNPIVTLSIE